LVAPNLCSLQVQWFMLLLGVDLAVAHLETKIFCDNQSTVTIAHSPVASDRSRHIQVKYKKVQELIDSQFMSVKWKQTSEQLADIFRRQLPRPQYEYLRTRL
jgi:hypothetical protein